MLPLTIIITAPILFDVAFSYEPIETLSPVSLSSYIPSSRRYALCMFTRTKENVSSTVQNQILKLRF